MDLKKSMSQKLRMDGRDYSRPGWYFVTLGADYHRHFFGSVEGSMMRTNSLGQLVAACWCEIPQHYGHIELGACQVMPNHLHGLIRIVRPGGKGLGEVINLFKGSVTREWRRAVGSRHGEKERIWAPNYYDVICFDAEELETKERYIRANPQRWALKRVPQGIIEKSRYKGNKMLLQQAGNRKRLRVSRRASDAQVASLQADLTGFDGIACSTFFSPGERACLDTVLAGEARIIWVMPMAMPKTIPEKWTKAFLEERALWLSAFPDGQEEATRESCEQANYWVEQVSCAE